MNASALLFATAASAHGEPAAALVAGGSTLVGRLVAQLQALGVRRVWLVTRPAWKETLEEATTHSGVQVTVVASGDRTEDLRTTAEIADRVRGGLIIGSAHVLTHREALAGLLADPRISSGILGTSSAPWFSLFPVRTVRGRVVSAASQYHVVSQPNNYSLAFVKVDAGDRGHLIAASRHLAELMGGPEPWENQLGRLGVEWRLRLWQEATERETGVAPDPDDLPDVTSIRLDPESEAEVELRLRAAEEDVVDLLVVSLVRTGVHLRLSALRGFFYAAPLSAHAIGSATEELSTYDEDRIALDSAVKAKDGFFTTFFVSPYSKYVAYFGAHRGWTPNWVTAASFAIGGIAAASFALGNRAGLIAGAVLLQIAFAVDCVDGQLARYTRTFSRLGAWLDSVLDRSKEYVVYGGLAIGAARGFGDDVWTLAAAALTLQTFRHMLDFAYAARHDEAIEETPLLSLEEPNDVRLSIDLHAREPAHVVSRFDLHPTASATAVVPQAPSRLAVASAGEPHDAATAQREQRLAFSTFARHAVDGARALDRWTLTRWAKRILVLPIGERFALISLTAAVWSPRVTFVALLAWGGIAAAYAVVGRILAAIAR